ncbi:2Fe-2S iron-sulfur cluster binding domain-containing protein [Algoriphagus lutimaris]|uniref:adenylate/guanylate cyclase domain-containing protein n=1 Tax=Algoriphagus lutimaris TaxID=613197 RepID=UPI00196BA777|nr:adenylate/guanylate cyclase domain-containing protein [Algoriphagus lutimaris]MBN3521302.1 2Fe-2S iron-sulfur cluster binding domain-containing protein [Algoriphagus lutimaris]
MMKQKITYAGINRVVENDDDMNSLLDISIANQITHLHECGGHGRCTTCRVRILEGINNLNPKNQLEQETSYARKWDPSIRLACQSYPKGDVTLQRLIWSMGEVNQLQKELSPVGKAEERPIAILFCDLRNYTNLSSNNLNYDMAFLLNKFYTALGDPILMNNGIIYQYVGDEIIGVFGTTGGTRDKICTDAIRAGLGMHFALTHLNNTELKDLDIKLNSGIGINFGKAYIGHLGHPTHKQFSVIGDPVNVASRIQEQTKVTQSKILISKTVLNSIPKDTLEIGETYLKELKGKEEPAELFELLAFKEMDMQLELQASLPIMMENPEEFASIFYDKVFEIDPNAKSLFRNNMTDQGRLLTHMLGGIIYSLSRPEHLVTGLQRLGENHVKYGVQATHYPVVKEALLYTINKTLGGNNTEKCMNAWNSALDFVMDVMKGKENPS